MSARPVAGRRETFTERRERRAEVEDPAVVLEAAARFLEARPRSIAEIRRRLSTAGYRRELVDAAIARLVDLGLVDDAEFARTWVASRDRARPRGEIALRRELQLKGIDRSIVDAVLAERGDSDDSDTGDADLDGARRLLVRHARALAREPDARRRRQRAYVLLARHGFPPDAAAQASREAVIEPSDDEQLEPD